MAYPTVRDLEHSYTANEAPDADFPGTELDNDLFNVLTTLQEIRDYLELIGTSEGRVRAAAVPDLPADIEDIIAEMEALLAATELARDEAEAAAAPINVATEAEILAAADNAKRVTPLALTYIRLPKLPEAFGWTSGGSLAARTTAMKLWAADSSPARLRANTDYTIDISGGGLLVAAGKIIEGNGAWVIDQTNHGKLVTLVPGSVDGESGYLRGGWKIHGLNLRGARAGTTYNSAGYGIYVSGTDNVGAGTAPTFVSEFWLDDIRIEDVGFAGLWALYLADTKLNNVRVNDVGYAGNMFVSCFGVRYTQLHVQDIGPGSEAPSTPSTSYGCAVTKFPSGVSGYTITSAPVSTDCVFDGWRVLNNPYYTAMDTHAGDSIKFLNGYAYNVHKGINVGYDVDSADATGGRDCVVANNYVEGTLSANNSGLINVGYAGAANGYARNNKFIGNTVVNFGSLTTGGGGVFLQGTRGALIDGNTCRNSRSRGIIGNGDNLDCAIINNYIDEVTDNDVDYTAIGISVDAANHTGVFGGNKFKRTGAASTSMSIAYNIDNWTGVEATFLGGDVFNGTMTKYIKGSNAVFKNSPLQQEGSATLAALTANNLVQGVVTFPVAFSVAPKVIVTGQGLFNSKVIVISCDPASTTTTQCTIIARTADATTFGANGNISVNWIASGY
jgi:hypothetical protein